MNYDLSACRRACVLVALLAPHLGLPAAARAQNKGYAEHPINIAYHVLVPMRDGVRLSVDIYRPITEARVPTIMAATPYNNKSDGSIRQAWQYVQRGYAYVAVDSRGRYDSEGEFAPWRNDGPDGSDVMSWIARQPWSNGRIATVGGSYGGKNQWLMAKENNPHHAAIISSVAPADDFHDGTRYNGVPKLDLMYTWMMGMYGRVNQPRTGWDWAALMHHLPLSEMGRAAGRNAPVWREMMENDVLNAWWDPSQVRGSYERFDIPSFNVSGWFDGQLKGAIQNYENSVRTSARPAEHKLVVGPWLHGVNRQSTIGERDYGPGAIIDLNGLRNAWVDHQMLGTTPAREQPNVLYFVPVKNEWRTADAWPIPATRFTPYHLDSGGRANTLSGDGVLRSGQPGSGPADVFRYDPANPVPTVSSRTSGARGGLPQGSVDNSSVERREDVLVYTSEALADGVEITGPVKAMIYFSTDVPDTDITVKLLDVDPAGRALNITHGIARAKYRDSYSQPTLLESGTVYSVEVELFPTSNYFAPGHRIRIEVSSSDFPNFARNLNTGDSDTGTEMRIATTRIHHRGEHASHIVLPVIPTGATTPWAP